MSQFKHMRSNKSVVSIFIIAVTLFVSSCVQGTGSTGKRARIKDFSIVEEFKGCPDAFLLMDKSSPDTCSTACPAGLHAASAEEKAELIKALTEDENDGLVALINNSGNICLEDVTVVKRPTLQIDVRNDFCSCINGKSDIINDCDAICESKPFTTEPTLYVNGIVGPEIELNDMFKNVHNWCTQKIESDDTDPMCTMEATDGTNTIRNIPVQTNPGSNSWSANLTGLALDRTYVVKLIESKAGSEAQSKEFQIRRKRQTTNDNSSGALKITPISQYSCISYGQATSPTTNLTRRITDSFSKYFYYFPSNETPAPMPPVAGGNESTIVCHDEQLYPGNDKTENPRLELIPQAFAMWDKSDSRFAKKAEYGGKMHISKIIEDRLAQEHPNSGITEVSLFFSLNYSFRPPTQSTSATNNQGVLGFIMVPFTDTVTKKSYCPTAAQLQGTVPLFDVLGDYVSDTEGLFLSEKEAETVQNGSGYTPVYGTMFVTETTLKKYGFYIENQLKIKATDSSFGSKTIHFYWPTSPTADPLLSGGRKLFTVRRFDELSGNIPTTPPVEGTTTDKRIGCIPKSSN